MTPMTKKDAFARAMGVSAGWLLILAGATAQWGWPAALIVVGVFMAAPARYIAQDPIVVVD